MSEERRRPYVGLRPYSEKDAAFFFGRESERDIIISHLMASRLTILYGATGVGKSSILHAGVVHHIRQFAHFSSARKSGPDSQKYVTDLHDPEFAIVIFDNWQADPMLGLAQSIHN